MKNINFKKLISVTLSALMLVLVTVPGTNFAVNAAEPTSFPAPITSTAPTYLKEFAKPSASILVGDYASYVLPSTVTGSAQSGAPVVATITEQAGPDDSISIYGTNLEGASVYAYGLSGGVGVIKKLEQTSNKDGFINAVIDKNFNYGMYIIWVQGADGKVSAPVRVNAPKLTWISDTTAKSGATGIRIYGKFLTTNNADGTDATSYVYLTNGTTSYKATVTEATPYRLTVTLPTGLSNGTYKVWVHNGHGGDYGWSNALDLTISSTSGEVSWSTTSRYQVTVNPGDNLKTKIEGAKAGSTVTIKNGIYAVTSQISVSKKIRIVGESKDGVIIVGVFSKSGSGALAYGDKDTNSACKAAFYVTAQPCEFSNLTFVDYVEGAEYCSGITKPSDYSIDYAYGMFIETVDVSNDSGLSGQFKIDNCNFKIRRTYSNTNCIYFGDSTRETKHAEIEAIYGTQYYSRKPYGACPMWLQMNYSEVSNCYFETPKGMISRGFNNSYIHDNTFVGTWVLSGNSGPNAIHDHNSRNLDISNNRIYGMDEVTDADGYVKTYDKTFARTIVFQKTYNVTRNVYVMNNDISRVGELNYNSGEHILFEDENVTYVGKVTLSNNNKTLHLKDMPTEKWLSDNTFRGYITNDNGSIKLAGYTRNILGQYVVISKGKGAGQYREITSVAADRYVTISGDWDVQPDENSTFVVVSPFVNTVVYNNTIEGPKMYYKNFNSTLGIQAYGSMLGTVIDRNNFSQMQAGMSINTRYNIKTYTYNNSTVKVDFGFVMFADLLVTGNTISNTRYGIWNLVSITTASMDVSSAEADVDLQLCSIIRGNNISDSNRLTGGADTNDTVDTGTKKRGGASIVVGRDYWDYNQVLSTRYWMNNVVVENNTLSDVENNKGNGFIDVGFSQKDTILRNNTTDGELRTTYASVEVERNSTQHQGGKPVSPIYIIDSDDTIEFDGGTEEDGMIQNDSYTPNKKIANNHFLEGFKYWSNATGTDYASANATVANSIATISKGKNNGLKSASFKMPLDDLSTRSAENKVAFVVKYTGTSTAFNVQLYVNGVSKGNASSNTYSAGKLKLFYYDNVYWNSGDIYHLAITSNTGTSTISIDYVDVARCETKNAILDLVDGRVYNYTDGDITDDTSNNEITEDFTNVEFETGIDQWAKTSHFGGVTAANGIVTLESAKFQSNYFPTTLLNSGDKIAIIYKFNSITNAKVSLLRKDVKGATTTDSTLISPISTTQTALTITDTVTYTAVSDTTSYIALEVEGAAILDYFSVVKVTGSGINLVYTDIVSGKRYLSDMRDPDGTEAGGFEKLYRAYANSETYAINDTLMNGDFSEGFKYWSAAINTTATSSGIVTANAADSGSVQNGVATITPSLGTGRGISTAHFKVPNAQYHKQFALMFDFAHTAGDVTGLTEGTDYTEAYKEYFKGAVFKGASHTEVANIYLNNTKGAWSTASIVVDITDPDEFYVFSIEGFNIKSEFKLKNVRLMYVDDGGEGDLVGLDGSLVGYDYGDVNKDGEINLLDYARIVKFMAGVEGTTMYKAAANLNKDANITLDATDLTYLKEYLITGNKNF